MLRNRLYAPELKQSINAVFFSFEIDNRQFHVITCSLFLNDLCLKKSSLSRSYDVKYYNNVSNVVLIYPVNVTCKKLIKKNN